MFDIITFGSATWDIFIKPKKFSILPNKKEFLTGKGICFNMGSKIDVEGVNFSSGGGGTNTAATFAKQGFKVAYCGALGRDIGGQEIIRELGKSGINAELVFKTDLKPTNHSIILSTLSAKQDRTVLAYRGASEILEEKDIPWDKLKTKWLYLAPLSGPLSKLFKPLVNFAKKNNIKIAANPGNSQLSLPKRTLEEIVAKLDILILNQEEAALLTKTSYQKEKEIFKKIDEICPGIAIMTKGPKGVLVSDGKYLFSARPLPQEKMVDRTGAGDSFASGFVSGYIHSKGDIEYAIQLGIANSTSCLTKWGAKNGLLEKGENFIKVRVNKIVL